MADIGNASTRTSRVRQLPAARKKHSHAAWVAERVQIIQEMAALLGYTWTGTSEDARWAKATLGVSEHGEVNAALQSLLNSQAGLYELLVMGLERLGLFDDRLAEDNDYDLTILPGAKPEPMFARFMELLIQISLGMLRTHGVVIHTGDNVRTDKLGMTKADIVGKIPTGLKQHWWVAAELAKSEPTPPEDFTDKQVLKFSRRGGPFDSEYKVALLWILVGLFLLGVPVEKLELKFLELPAEDDNDRAVAEITGEPGREDMGCELMFPGVEVPILVINAPAIPRNDGKGVTRPNATSACTYWLRHFTIDELLLILVKTGRVHGPRLAGRIEHAIHGKYPHCTVDATWPGSNDWDKDFAAAMSELGVQIQKAYAA